MLNNIIPENSDEGLLSQSLVLEKMHPSTITEAVDTIKKIQEIAYQI